MRNAEDWVRTLYYDLVKYAVDFKRVDGNFKTRVLGDNNYSSRWQTVRVDCLCIEKYWIGKK